MLMLAVRDIYYGTAAQRHHTYYVIVLQRADVRKRAQLYDYDSWIPSQGFLYCNFVTAYS